MNKNLNIDLLSPAAITAKAETVGVEKANNNFKSIFMLAVMAGVFIALAGEFYTIATFDTQLGASLTKLLGGIVFSLGLILVVVAGAELFTGNTLLVIAYMTNKISLAKLIRNWAIVYVGNLAGSLFIVWLVYYSKQWEIGNYLFGSTAISIAYNKVNYDFMTALIKGTLCNLLVVLAVWLAYSGRSLTDKIMGIIFPITAFVASGFEHSVANMYFIPMGLLLKHNPPVSEAFTQYFPNADLTSLTTYNFIFNNLIPVTIGNIIGGSILVGLAYWFVYLHKFK